ncbi:SDR family oxidoreductase [Tamlana crocina]|uniref:SDR family oxidoreductase n=1 Tax=Tamlana crocina TaxID=393006 RepID=A0ABX1DEU8_9FLAO|nr:SDR family oxidoreductase [Tamlana crocina]NJX16775.1 SDR family oxidoreductase [Tamlana crocina]
MNNTLYKTNHAFVPKRFEGKVAIVTGGASGLGRAITEEFCKEGGKVLFTDISESGKIKQEEDAKNGYNTTFLMGDMGDEAFCKACVVETNKKYGKIDYLVNNAFSFAAAGMNAKTEDWMRSFKVGPLAYARMAQEVYPYMKKYGGGAIVNISSISAHIAQKDRWTYNTSKGAVNQLTKCQALDFAPYKIRVNSVDPGWIWTKETDKAANLDGGGREKWDPIWGRFHILRRMGLAIEVARPVLFLLSNDASFITGTNLAVDGGYLAIGSEGLGENTINAGSQ